jgi:hypothetical protein
MNGVITPSTNVVWGAYPLEIDAQWKEIENAALAVIYVKWVVAGSKKWS